MSVRVRHFVSLYFVCFVMFCLDNNAFANLESCGSVVSIDGTECESLRVQMDLAKCEGNVQVVAAKMKCGAGGNFATYQSQKFNYRLAIDFQETWGKKPLRQKGGSGERRENATTKMKRVNP
jgi:hypothetical protein